MKNLIILFTTLLVLWIAGCTYIYVCKIRKDCQKNELATSPQPSSTMAATDTLTTTQTKNQANQPPVYTIRFNTGKGTWQLTNEDKSYFTQLKLFLDKNPDQIVKVTAYADNTGSEAVNQKVCTQRAAFVIKQLEEAGIASKSLESAIKGSLEPLADNSTPEGRAQNRRVEIQIK